MTQLLLGFDVRAGTSCRSAAEGIASAWDRERRHIFLIRPDAIFPLSVDRTVWPRVEETEMDELPLNSAVRLPNQLPEVLNAAEVLEIGSGSVIGITVNGDETDARKVRRAFGPGPNATPEHVLPEWILLGYDIADRYFTSGISNCGYDAAHWKGLRARWGDRVNEHNLFDGFQPARKCLVEVEQLVKEHAPFFVFGVWLIPERPTIMADRGGDNTSEAR